MKAKYVTEVSVIDPDTKGLIDLAVFKHENGGMFAIDQSYLDQVATEHETEDCYVIPDPLSNIDEPTLLFLYD